MRFIKPQEFFRAACGAVKLRELTQRRIHGRIVMQRGAQGEGGLVEVLSRPHRLRHQCAHEEEKYPSQRATVETALPPEDCAMAGRLCGVRFHAGSVAYAASCAGVATCFSRSSMRPSTLTCCASPSKFRMMRC